MSLKELLGEELYQQVTEKLGDKKIDIVNDGRWIPKEKFDALNNEKNDYKSQVDNLKKELDKLQKVVEDNQDAASTIENLKQQIADKEAALIETRKQFAIESVINDHKGKNAKAIKALLDLSNIELDDDGKVKGLEEQLKKLKETDPYLFDEVTPTGTGGSIGNGSKDNKKYPEKNPYRKETWSLTQQAILEKENPELAKQLKAQANQN